MEAAGWVKSDVPILQERSASPRKLRTAALRSLTASPRPTPPHPTDPAPPGCHTAPLPGPPRTPRHAAAGEGRSGPPPPARAVTGGTPRPGAAAGGGPRPRDPRTPARQLLATGPGVRERSPRPAPRPRFRPPGSAAAAPQPRLSRWGKGAAPAPRPPGLRRAAHLAAAFPACRAARRRRSPVAAGEWGQVRPPNSCSLRPRRRRRRPSVRCLLNFSVWLFGL